MDDHAYAHALSLLPGVGSGTLKALLNHFDSAEAAWQADSAELAAVPRLSQKAQVSLRTERRAIDVAAEWQNVEQADIGALTILDQDYPALLKETPDAPALLYVRGNYDFRAAKPCIAVVGSRKFTDYGKLATERLVSDLAQAGLTVVSGLAFGIDSLAHQAALDAGGETLAVLGGGINDGSIAPVHNFRLSGGIIRSGALISEYRPGTRPTVGTFPARNRIIAGLSLGTLLIEAAPESGSLITARLALDYNREVFAVPGSIFASSSLGTNRLIREGAKMVTCLEDVLAELPGEHARTKREQPSGETAPLSLSPAEEKILRILADESLHVDKVIKLSTLDAALVSSTLAILEVRGLVKNIGGMHYIRCKI